MGMKNIDANNQDCNPGDTDSGNNPNWALEREERQVEEGKNHWM